MTRRTGIALVAFLAAGITAPALGAGQRSSGLSSLPATGTVDPRFLSYNIEMAEVTGGNFWKPYSAPPAGGPKAYRGPIDLDSAKLRHLAAALAPAYVRYSGTWANATWFTDAEAAPAKAPAGFDTVLTRQQWRSAVSFAKASDAKIVTSFASSLGTRDAAGVWQTDTAARWLAYTRQIGGTIAAAEFVNEPSVIQLTQPPKGYTPEDYRRDYARFVGWIRKASPQTLIVAPGTAELAEPARSIMRKSQTVWENEQLLALDSPKPDVFSFHFYSAISLRCGGAMMGSALAKAASPALLDSVDAAIALVTHDRDRLAPGKPIWNTESAEGACGGNPWAATFADSFRFVDTLGRSARQGVRVFMHNTLAASDYALLDEKDFSPRPNYWAAVLWKRTMGTTVLAPPVTPSPEFRVYAHCLPGKKGGVGLAAVNVGDTPQQIAVGPRAQAWVLTAPAIDSKALLVNGQAPSLSANGSLAGLDAVPAAGSLTVPGKGIVFVAVAGAGNRACR
ncbi:hypothetical protein WG901_09570 [Novosphingobium sp. PS1R-30]|uniref:Glycosyl hydrolase family 79 n=1 Tax=Novosphingobium anseongense TaxID=3133436 RepID=A0ABU8RVZ7_9SPHN